MQFHQIHAFKSGTTLFVIQQQLRSIYLLFGAFDLSTKEPFTVMLCPSCIVLHCHHHHGHLCTALLPTALDLKTLYLV